MMNCLVVSVLSDEPVRYPNTMITVEIEKSRQSLNLEVSFTQTVGSVMRMAANRAGIPLTSELALAHHGSLLDSSTLLGMYRIQNNDKLILRPCFRITVLLPSKRVCLPVFPDETILSIRTRLSNLYMHTLNTQLKMGDLYLDDTKRIQEYNIADDEIRVIMSIQGGSQVGVPFSDMSGMEQRQFSSDAPDYRRVGFGINFECVCRSESCPAKGCNVICPMGMGTFDVARVSLDLKCPLCEAIPDPPHKCGFYMTHWEYKGQLQGSKTRSTSNGDANTNEYHVFKDGQSVTWSWLEFKTSPLK